MKNVKTLPVEQVDWLVGLFYTMSTLMILFYSEVFLFIYLFILQAITWFQVTIPT